MKIHLKCRNHSGDAWKRKEKTKSPDLETVIKELSEICISIRSEDAAHYYENEDTRDPQLEPALPQKPYEPKQLSIHIEDIYSIQ
jgi:hypothetical protein